MSEETEYDAGRIKRRRVGNPPDIHEDIIEASGLDASGRQRNSILPNNNQTPRRRSSTTGTSRNSIGVTKTRTSGYGVFGIMAQEVVRSNASAMAGLFEETKNAVDEFKTLIREQNQQSKLAKQQSEKSTSSGSGQWSFLVDDLRFEKFFVLYELVCKMRDSCIMSRRRSKVDPIFQEFDLSTELEKDRKLITRVFADVEHIEQLVVSQCQVNLNHGSVFLESPETITIASHQMTWTDAMNRVIQLKMKMEKIIDDVQKERASRAVVRESTLHTPIRIGPNSIFPAPRSMSQQRNSIDVSKRPSTGRTPSRIKRSNPEDEKLDPPALQMQISPRQSLAPRRTFLSTRVDEPMDID